MNSRVVMEMKGYRIIIDKESEKIDIGDDYGEGMSTSLSDWRRINAFIEQQVTDKGKIEFKQELVGDRDMTCSLCGGTLELSRSFIDQFGVTQEWFKCLSCNALIYFTPVNTLKAKSEKD